MLRSRRCRAVRWHDPWDEHDSAHRQTDKFEDSVVEESSSRRGHGLYPFWVFVRDDGLFPSIFAATVGTSRVLLVLVVVGVVTFGTKGFVSTPVEHTALPTRCPLSRRLDGKEHR